MVSNLKDMYGITVTDIYDNNLEAKLKKLRKDPQKTIARIVVDKVEDYSDYIPAFQLVGRYAQCLLQVSDSYLNPLLTDDEYNARELWFLEHLSEYCEYIEIGNEVGRANNWSGENMKARILRSSKLWIGHERCLTIFWPGSVDALKQDLSDYSPVSREHTLISFYPQSLMDFDAVSRFDGLMFGEFGFENWIGKPSDKMKQLVIRKAYKIGSPGFYWDFQSEAKY